MHTHLLRADKTEDYSGEYKWGQSKWGQRDSEFVDQKFDGLPEPRAELKRDGNVSRIFLNQTNSDIGHKSNNI